MKHIKVLLLSRYGRLGASSRVRFYQYIPYLEAQGINTTVTPLLGDHYLEDFYAGRRKRVRPIFDTYLRRLRHLLKSNHFDLLWIEKELFPYAPAWGEAMLNCIGIPYVVDYDDAVFHSYDRHSNILVRSLWGAKIDAVMRRAALVTVCNDYLADRAWRAGAKRIENLPTVIDLDRYQAVSPVETGAFRVGWIGSPTADQYLSLVRSALAEVLKDGDAQLIVVGSDRIQLDSVPVVTRAWSEAAEVADIQDFDVGIMPLADGPWQRGKCGYKLIQYMACGLPVVASPVGVNRRIVEDKVNGFLATTATDWVRALSALRANRGLRERMGRAGRAKVETEYCVQVTAPRLVTLLRSAAKGVN